MNTKLFAALVAGALVLAGAASPAAAASPVTEAFLANITPNVDFLDRSSRFALTNSKSARLRDFARGQAVDQTTALNAMWDWSQNVKKVEVAQGDNAPLQTGRSAAVADPRLPMGQEDLDSLEGIDGQAFDALYKEKQVDALRQIQTDYETYIAKGDDPVLLGIAGRELPKVKRRLAQLGKI